MIDPWELPAGVPPVDLILITHEHHDHLSLADVQQMTGPDTAHSHRIRPGRL